MKNPTFKGKEIKMEGWAHKPRFESTYANTHSYNLWIDKQQEIYNFGRSNFAIALQNISKELNHPLTHKEITDIVHIIPSYSGAPILEGVKEYYNSANPLNSVALYLGAGNDFNHSSLFFPSTSIFIDYDDQYHSMNKSAENYFKNAGYRTDFTIKNQQNILTLEKDGLIKKFIFLEENIAHKETIQSKLLENNIDSVDFLIQKKVSGHPECALNFSDMLSKSGLLLYSDIFVYKSVPSMTQLWYGELNAERLQDMGDPDLYPAKLFRKE